MKKIVIIKDDLTTAFESTDSYSLRWYLDRETGEFIPITEEYMAIDEEDEESEEYQEYIRVTEDETGRYLYIEPMESHEAYKIMENFIWSLGDTKAADDLANAIQKRRPFYNFKETLYMYPELVDKWYAYKEESILVVAREYLDYYNVEYVLKDRQKSQ